MSHPLNLSREFTTLYTSVAPKAASRFGQDAVQSASLRVWVRLNRLDSKALAPLFADGQTGAIRYFWRSVFHAFLELRRRDLCQPTSVSNLTLSGDELNSIDRQLPDPSADVGTTALALADLRRVYLASDERIQRGMLLRLGKTIYSLTVHDLRQRDVLLALPRNAYFVASALDKFAARNAADVLRPGASPRARQDAGTWASAGTIAGLLVTADNVILDTLGFAPRVAVTRTRDVA